MRHMERCFNKYEGQTSYGSVFKTKIENLFCDVFNPHQRTYCKRLRILCPEHSKDPKVGDDEICGCPLFVNCFEVSGNYCRELKKACQKHHCWEKLRRAEIDAERVQQWLKIDELFEKEQKIRFTMTNRGGVLGLMLHQTVVHNEG
jgi:COMPASS component SPP1